MLTYMFATDSRHTPDIDTSELTKVQTIRNWFHHDHLFMDKAFDKDRWQTHRTWRRHLPEGFTFLRVLHTLGWPVFFYVAVSLIVCAYAEWAEDAGAPRIFSGANSARSQRYYIALLLTSFAVGLLIVFRTNSSYARWWEGRVVWGGLLNITRNIMRQCCAWFPAEEEGKLEAVERWNAALAPLLKMHCAWESDVHKQLQDILLPAELNWLSTVDNAPIMAASMLTNIIASVKLPDMIQLAIDEKCGHYVNAVGACERLQKQPIPVAYTRHTSRFLIWWLFGFPFAAWSSYGWGTPFVTAIVTFLLLGTENIGIQIEQPFQVLPMGPIAQGCVQTVREIFAQHKEVRRLGAEIVQIRTKSHH